MRVFRFSENRAASVRRFLFEISTIFVGVLIALSVDGISDWRRDKRLVHEARANLVAELTENQKELRNRLDGIRENRRQIDRALALAADLLQRGHKVKREDLTLHMGMATLNRSARDTAETTGAFGLMSYAEVRRYTLVYGRQEVFSATQDRLFQQFVLVIPVAIGRLADLSQDELQTWRANLKVLLQHLHITEQTGHQLLRSYADIIAPLQMTAPVF